jgi:peptidoglycan hydrolase-like protein with peptidoglycan-binding domain
MTNIVTTATSKAIVAFVAAAMIFTMFATPAKAQTVEELQAQINALMAQIAALSGGTAAAPAAAACGPWTRDLRTGMTGADVRQLQQYLNRNADTRVAATGAGSAGMETEFYGPATAAAVSKFQVMHMAEILTPNGLTSPTGFFGPSTRAKMNALCAAAPTTPTTPTTPGEDGETTPTTPALQGGEGDVKVETLIDGPIVIDLGKAETVLEFEVEAIDSDIAINRVDFEFRPVAPAINARPWLYFKEVNLLVNGEEVASLSRSADFTELSNGNWRARFAGLNLVIREDDTADVALELVALDSMSGTRDQDTIEVFMLEEGLRFVDGAGISSLGGPEVDVFATVEFDDAFDEGEIKLSVADNSPEKATIVLNETSRTENVTVLVFNAEAKDSDMKVKEVEVTFAVGASTVANAVNRARLFAGNTLLSTKSVTSNTVVFDKLDADISKDDERQMRIVIDFNRGEDFAVPPTTFTVTGVMIKAENKNFEPDTDTLPSEEPHTLLVKGLVPESKGITSSTQSDGKVVTINFSVDATAYGENQFVSATGTTAFPGIVLEGPAGATTTSVAVSSNGTLVGNAYRINRGQTRTFDVSVQVSGATSTGQVRVTLPNMIYGQTSTVPTGSTAPLGSPDYRSGFVTIIDSAL